MITSYVWMLPSYQIGRSSGKRSEPFCEQLPRNVDKYVDKSIVLTSVDEC